MDIGSSQAEREEPKRRDLKWFGADFIGICDVSGPFGRGRGRGLLQGRLGLARPDGFCISQAKLAEVCGTPAGAPCKQEEAPRVCFGNKS